MDGFRISELARGAGVATSTIRYYERIGLLEEPERTPAGYRVYPAAVGARLTLITRAKRLGLSLDQIAELLAGWDGVNCAATQDEVSRMLASKIDQVRRQIAELSLFADELEHTRARLADTAAPPICDVDLTCCAPALGPTPVDAPGLAPKGPR